MTGSPRRPTVFVAIGAMLVMLLAVPVYHRGWAAVPTTLIWGRSGDVFTLDIPLSTDTQSTMVATQLYNTLTRAKPSHDGAANTTKPAAVSQGNSKALRRSTSSQIATKTRTKKRA